MQSNISSSTLIIKLLVQGWMLPISLVGMERTMNPADPCFVRMLVLSIDNQLEGMVRVHLSIFDAGRGVLKEISCEDSCYEVWHNYFLIYEIFPAYAMCNLDYEYVSYRNYLRFFTCSRLLLGLIDPSLSQKEMSYLKKHCNLLF